MHHSEGKRDRDQATLATPEYTGVEKIDYGYVDYGNCKLSIQPLQ